MAAGEHCQNFATLTEICLKKKHSLKFQNKLFNNNNNNNIYI